METTRVKIDENHVLDIYYGEELQNQPFEAQNVFNNYVNENGVLLWWTRNADTLDELNRPTHWRYEWGELVAECNRTYRYFGAKGRRNWTALTETINLFANKK